MSQQANRILQEALVNREEGKGWEATVDKIRRKCEVQRNTAEQYIRRSDEAVIEQTSDGEKRVFAPEHAGDTLVANEDRVLEAEVGQPTGETFGKLPILEDIGHPEVDKSHESGYIRRRMGERGTALGRKTDVDIVTSAMADEDFSTLLIGKHGVGKDKLVMHICAKTNRPVIRLVANDDPDFVDLLIGTYAPDGSGNFTRKKGLLQVALENGYTFALDEFNALSGKVQTMLNKILEDSDSSSLVIPETNEVITPHPEFRFVATQNPNEVGYGGREDLDQATSSRFIPVEVPPLGESGEKQVVANMTHWEKDDADLDRLLREDGGVITGIRTLHDMGKMSTWISTRDVVQIGRMAERLGDTHAAAELILTGRVAPENEESVRTNIGDQNWS